MPYIHYGQRCQVRDLILHAHSADDLGSKIRETFPKDNIAGVLNYLFSSILKEVYRQPSYRGYNEAIGVLECVKLELYRRHVSNYEDKKIQENGDI